MEDTTSEIKQLVYRTVMARTEEERFLMCAEMFETAREFAKIGMPANLTETEKRAFIFKRIHGEEPLQDPITINWQVPEPIDPRGDRSRHS